MRRLAIIILGLSLVALPAMLMQPALSLKVVTGDGVPIICSRVTSGTAVTLEFTHSMFGGYVRETYHVDEQGRLKRESVVTGNAAAAEYYAIDGRTRHLADGYEVLGPSLVTEDLIVRVNNRGDHWLTIGQKRFHLAGMVSASTQAHIHGERTPAFSFRASCP